MVQTTRSANAEYQVMDRADAVIANVLWLRDSLRGVGGVDANIYRDVKFLTPIEQHILGIISDLKQATESDSGDAETEQTLSSSVEQELARAKDLATRSQSAESIASELDKAHKSLASISALMPKAARHHVLAGTEELSSHLTWSIFWLVVILIISAVIHVMQFRTMIRPLTWLRDQMQHAALTNYRENIRALGDREFKDVAGFFNGLSRDLANLYRDLEDRVITKSRELVRSERLASVGFLAAGVAHEINNPLSVIAGYAELAKISLQRVLLGPSSNEEATAEAEAAALSEVLEAQTMIRDEAFRCKDITSRLLSLARGGSDAREPLKLDEVAKQVAALTRGLRNYRNRKIVLDFDASKHLNVVANPTEMKQVFLNLTVNALEASPNDLGEVRIGGHATNDWVELFVEDNGKGMSRETLEQIFEPFFTAKRGAGEPGTGLGLSITHAIIENHGGGIRAESAGPGRGSRFTVRLPASGKSTNPSLLTAATGN